jgi:hypothetical protein
MFASCVALIDPRVLTQWNRTPEPSEPRDRENVIDVELAFSQFAPFSVFFAYPVSGLRDRASEISFMVAIVVTTVSVLVLHAL